MGTSTVNLTWIGSHFMNGIDSRGVPLPIGSDPEREPQWLGVKPSDLLLLAAASCSTWDVASILNKQHEPLEGLETTCTGEQMSESPYCFTKLHLHYKVKGKVKPKNVEKAIKLSEEKYCSVTNTLRGSVEITSSYSIEE
jgi:putative redox protein